MTSTLTPNQTEADANRNSRHLAMLEEMAGLAMALSRAAAEKAQAQLEDPTPEPGPAAGSDPTLAFTRLARTVRQIIALEARIADPTYEFPSLDHDPRELIAEAVTECAKGDPATARRHCPTRAHIDERIDADDITRLIGRNANVAEIIERICDSLGIHFDITEQPVERLLRLTEAQTLKRQRKAIRPTPPLPSTEGPGTAGHDNTRPTTPPRSRDPT